MSRCQPSSPTAGDSGMTVDLSLCTVCGLCAKACPCEAIVMTDAGPQFLCEGACRRTPTCVALVHGFLPCEEACPSGAIGGLFLLVSSRDDLRHGV